VRPTYKTRVLVAYVVGVFIQILDATAVNVALPAIGDDFGVRANEVEWVVLGYLLSLAIGIPAAPWIADRIGSKRAFIIAIAGFVAASILCGLAPSLAWLVAARVLQGLPSGLILPIGAAILYRAFPQNERARAASAVIGVAVVAPSIGPILGGILVDNLSWRWIFFINLPIGILAVTLAWAWLREEDSDPAGHFDTTGFALAAIGLAGVLYALSSGPREGWTSTITVAAAVIGVIALIALVRFELSTSSPLVDLRLLADHHFRVINLYALSTYAAFISLIYVLPIYLQGHRGLSATAAGTTQAPQAIAIFLVSNLAARRAFHRFGPRLLLRVGAVAAALVSGTFAFVGDDTGLWLLRAGTFGRGLAMGFLFVSLQTVAYATTSHADTGRAVSIFTTQRQIAIATGTAVAATSLTASLNADLGLTAYRVAFGIGALLFLPAFVISFAVRESEVAATRDVPPNRAPNAPKPGSAAHTSEEGAGQS